MAAAILSGLGVTPEFSTAPRTVNNGSASGTQRRAQAREAKLWDRALAEGKHPVLKTTECDGEHTIQIHVYTTAAQAIFACIIERFVERKYMTKNFGMSISKGPPDGKFGDVEQRDTWYHEYSRLTPTGEVECRITIYEFQPTTNFATPTEVGRIRKLFSDSHDKPIEFVKANEDGTADPLD